MFYLCASVAKQESKISAIIRELRNFPAASGMKLFTPTPSRRLNEVTGFLFLSAGLLILLSLASFHPGDPSWNHVGGHLATRNLIGRFGAHLSDLLLQAFGLGSFVLPLLVFALGWKWIRSEATEAPTVKIVGSCTLLASACGAAALLPPWRLFDHTILPGGTAGFLIADSLRHSLNVAGAAVILITSVIVSVYFVSTFTLSSLQRWFGPVMAFFASLQDRWRRYLERRREAKLERLELKREAAEQRALEREAALQAEDEEAEEPVAETVERTMEIAPPIVQTVDPALSSRGRSARPHLFPKRCHGKNRPLWSRKLKNAFRRRSMKFRFAS